MQELRPTYPQPYGFASQPIVLGPGPALGGVPANYFSAPPLMYGGPSDAVLYDETSNQPVMYDRRQTLVEQGHSVVPLSVAYRTRLAALQAEINGSLLARRDSLLKRVASIQVRAEEVRAVKGTLEREALALLEAMLDKLRTTEALKMTMLQREREEAARGLEEIQAFVGEASSASQAQDMLEFLQQYPALIERCKRLASRPISEKVEVSAQDFESEAHVYADLSNRFGALQKLISLKDTMIWELLEIRSKLQGELQEARDAQELERSRAAAEADALKRQVEDLKLQLVKAQAVNSVLQQQGSAPIAADNLADSTVED